jgi:hypothetical protein
MGMGLSVPSADWKSWWRVLNQGSTYLGLAMIGLIWLGLNLNLATEMAAVQQGAIQNASNLTRAFEEHLIRTLREVDRTLQMVRNAYSRSPETFNLAAFTKEQLALDGPAFQVGIIDRSGLMVDSSEGRLGLPIDLRDREHFGFHLNEQARQAVHQQPADRAPDRQVVAPAVAPHQQRRWQLWRGGRRIPRSSPFQPVL